MDYTLQELWKRTSTRLQQLVAPQIFKRWFEPIRASHMEGNCLHLQAPSHLYQYWLEDNYGDLLRETLSSIAERTLTFHFIRSTETEKEAQRVLSVGTEELTSRNRGSIERKNVLNPAFTFNNFVVGPSNQYAHAGCWAVAQSPGRAYNPLFIYGATGLGKTHLMHAIGHHLVSQNKTSHVA